MADLRDLLLVAIPLAPALWANFRQGRVRRDRKETSDFRTVFQAQRTLVENCERRCSDLQVQMRELRQEHAAERTAATERHRIEVKDWRDRFIDLERRNVTVQARVDMLEDFLREQGYAIPKSDDEPPRRREEAG